jgi:hypothetical protein
MQCTGRLYVPPKRSYFFKYTAFEPRSPYSFEGSLVLKFFYIVFIALEISSILFAFLSFRNVES